MALEIDSSTGYLPPGVHAVTWGQLTDLCGGNSHRHSLLIGLKNALLNLKAAGCTVVLLDGSFVSDKLLPNDYDGAWDAQGVDPNLIDKVLLTFDAGRKTMKAKYGGELFPASAFAEPGQTYWDFFQTDRDGNPKGVLLVDLGSVV